MKEQWEKATVVKIVGEGGHGPYAVAKTDKTRKGSVTFGLTPKIWLEKDLPTPGTVVMLRNIHPKEKGWRAEEARYFRSEDQQLAESSQQKAKISSMKDVVEKWEELLFPSLDASEIWNDWVTNHERRLEDLWSLVEDKTINDEFKARALYILLTPQFDLAQLGSKTKIGEFVICGFKQGILTTVSLQLLNFTADLVQAFVAESRGFSKGERVKLSKVYNNLILYLLERAPGTDIGLIDAYEMRYLGNSFDSNDFSPFKALLNSGIPEKFKRAADAKIRELIQEEEEKANGILPLIYERILRDQLPVPKYSAQLFASQIIFWLQEVKNHPRRPHFIGGEIAQALRLLNFQPLEEVFSLFTLEQVDSFLVDDDDTRDSALLMIGVLGEDNKWSLLLQKAIADFDAKKSQESQEVSESQQKERGLLAKMRKPLVYEVA